MNDGATGDNQPLNDGGASVDNLPLQRVAAADGLIGQVLPGVVAVVFIVIVLLAVMAGDRALMTSARSTNLATLQSVLTNTTQRLGTWADDRKSDVRVWSQEPLIVDAAATLAQTPMRSVLETAEEQQLLRETLSPWLTEYGYRGFQIVSPNGTILAAMRDTELAKPSPILDLEASEDVQLDEAIITHPHLLHVPDVTAPGDSGLAHEEAVMYAIGPIRQGDQTIAYLAFRIDPFGEFSSTFSVGRTGRTGETYAIDRTGLLMTETRYQDELVEAGLLAGDQSSMLNLRVRDPGVDITSGGIPSRPYSEWPLTLAASEVVENGAGHDLYGYRDARGVLVMGAWVWDDVRNLGIISEIEVSEALAGANQAVAVLRVFAVAMAFTFILLAVLFSAHRSITQQREMATHAANKRLSKILSTAAEGIYGIDGQGTITFINPRACDMLGYEEHELIGRNMHAVVHHSRRDGSIYPREECRLHSFGEPGESVDGDVFWSKSGQPIPIEASSSPLNPLDKHEGAVVTFRDITNRKRDELALRRYAQELKRSNSELQEFAYAASHDLQEPLRKIQAFGERLNNKCYDALDDNGRHYLERMVDAATRMRRLIDDLLSYSRVNSKTTSFLPVDLRSVVADVLSDLEPRIAASEAKVRVGELPAIEADPGQMHQLFLNLVANALKFCRPGVQPTISIEGSVEVGENGAMARIAVADNGVGFEPRHAERIFGMFERLHGRDEFDGTGVGLATCRKIAERHAGELTAWAEPDAGAVFTLLLPVRQGSLT
ncbi:sensor histidine kinase [Maricaulis sp. CAU 1757]